MTRSAFLKPLFSALPLASLAFAGPASHAQGDAPRAVFVASNDPGENEILEFEADPDGELDPDPLVHPTGGAGTGTGLGNQGGVLLSDDGRWLFVVNAGSDEISSFRVAPGGLELVDVVSSGGGRPISLTRHGDLLYVLNAGGLAGSTDSIVGFRLTRGGELEELDGSTQPLSDDSTDPAQIGFAPGGDVLVVTEKDTSLITTFVVDAGGLAGDPDPQPSAGTTPFGFAFDRRGRLFVSEAFGGAAEASALSSYVLADDGTLDVVDPSMATTETAACWVVLSRSGRFAYTTNTGSGSISGFAVSPAGELELLDSGGVTAETGGAPIDLDFSADGRTLYALDSGSGEISVLRQDPATGELSLLQTVEGLPAGANGLVAR